MTDDRTAKIPVEMSDDQAAEILTLLRQIAANWRVIDRAMGWGSTQELLDRGVAKARGEVVDGNCQAAMERAIKVLEQA